MAFYTNDNWVRRFSVSDPRKHFSGFTIYKVTSIIFPKGCPEAGTKVIIWKRYNDFKKLHRELKQKHKQLYLEGKFPPFAEAKFFRRFEEEVIEERRKCATVLLEFIGDHPALFASNIFVKFFESGYDQDEGKDLNCPVEFRNATVNTNKRVQNDVLCPARSSNEPNRTKSEGNGPLLKLGGTWEHPQVSDSISLSSQSSEEHTSYTDTDSVISGPGAPPQKEQSQELPQNNVEESNHSSNWMPSGETQTHSSPDVLEENLQDYIVQAKHHVTQAMRHQAAGAYDAAFSLLKLGISCLLTGVQDETDATRRHAVKSKASEYLTAAEKLYSEHLSPRFPSQAQLSPSSQPTACSLPSLQAFKVLGVIGKVMLAMSTEEDQCYIVKVLYKSPCPVNKCQVPILPQLVPFMVKLHFYFETDCAVYLFLQHASGGRLWDHIISYLQSQPPTPVHLLTQGNAYLGRKLIEESHTPLINEHHYSSETLLSTHDDSYATLIQNYREGKFEIKAEMYGKMSEACNSEPQSTINQKKDDTNGPCAIVVNDPNDSPKFPVSESSRMRNPSKQLSIDALMSDIDARSFEDLETKELMRNAQQLLQSVNETLLKTSIDDREVQNDFSRSGNHVSEESSPGRNKPRLKGLTLRRRSSGTRPSLEHRLSSDDLFECRTYSSGGGANMHHWEKPVPRLPEVLVREWGEQLVTCLAALHESGLVFRDLHPDNILLSEEGHLLLSFTCSWPAVDTVVNREAVEHLYAAPEVTSIFEPTPAVDWWSLGAILYELITGKPLHLSQPGGVHSHSILSFPDFVSAEAQSLLTELLRYYPQERLGTGVGGVEEIKSHPFFASTDWSAVQMAGLKT